MQIYLVWACGDFGIEYLESIYFSKEKADIQAKQVHLGRIEETYTDDEPVLG